MGEYGPQSSGVQGRGACLAGALVGNAVYADQAVTRRERTPHVIDVVMSQPLDTWCRTLDPDPGERTHCRFGYCQVKHISGRLSL